MAATVREWDRSIVEEEKRAAWLASTYGPCDVCKVDVGEDGIHRWSCSKVPTARRANRGRAPEHRHDFRDGDVCSGCDAVKA